VIDLEVRGGLGDVFIYLHQSTAYDEINAMGPGDKARITIISHNPFCDEIFKWHPKASQIEVVKSRHFVMEYDNVETRRSIGVQDHAPVGRPGRERKPIPFFESPEDARILAEKLPKGPYLAIAPTASGMEVENRNLPPLLIETAFSLCQKHNIPIVLLGRNFQGPHAYKPGFITNARPGVINLIDQLSVPGTAHVIKRARAVLAAHSALLLLSWYERKPVFVAYPPKYWHHDFSNPHSPFVFGKDYPETVHTLFSDYKPEMFAKFLDRNFPQSGGKPITWNPPHPIFESWYAPGGQGSGPGSSPEHTAAWRTYLEMFISSNGIKSVVDFGCGDWQFSRLVKWGEASYHGVDVVPSLIAGLSAKYAKEGVSFSCVDPDDPVLPDADLLVTKDVLQHLNNKTVSKLVEKFRKYKFVLLVNDWHDSNPNYDIDTVGWRPIDFAKPPFSIDVSLVFDFKDQWGKRAYLWNPK
jgi:ADP-heptose:LPS heptosyltransferase